MQSLSADTATLIWGGGGKEEMESKQDSVHSTYFWNMYLASDQQIQPIYWDTFMQSKYCYLG